MKFESVLVTGGAGFIGSHIVDALLAQGVRVGVLDNLSTGVRKNLPQESPLLRVHEGDIRDEEFVRRSVVDYEAVIHQAALVSVTRSIEDPERTNAVNVGGSLNLLMAARDAGVKRFVYSCYDSKTRVLTRDGNLKDYQALSPGDQVLSINPVSQLMEWKRIMAVRTYPYHGELLHFIGRAYDVLVTPNHKMLIETPSFGNGWNLRFEEASRTATRSVFRFPRGLWEGTAASQFSDELLYLVGLYVGDGYSSVGTHVAKTGLQRDEWLAIARDSKGRFRSIQANPTEFRDNRPRLNLAIPRTDKSRHKVEAALDSLQIKWNNRDDGVIDFYTDEFKESLLTSCGASAADKHIPRHILNLPASKLRFVLQGILDSDGDGIQNVSTTSRQLVLDLAELAAKLGGSIAFREYEGKRTWIEDHWADCGRNYRLSVRRVPKWAIGRHKVRRESYDGIVWCPEVEGNHNLLIERNGKFVFCGNSSSSAYGESEVLPKVESMVARPVSPYGVSKLAAENYCRVFAGVYGLHTVSLRYFNVYGPRQKQGPYSGVIPEFVSRVASGKAPVIFGDGLQTRDFTFVEDVVQANLLSLKADVPPGEVFNIAAGNQVTLNGLAATIARLMGRPDLGAEHEEPRKGDVKHSYSDISKARSLLGYSPRFSLEQGLQEVIRTFGLRSRAPGSQS